MEKLTAQVCRAFQSSNSYPYSMVIFPVMPRFFGGGCVGALRAESGIFEDQGAAISEGDFYKFFMNAASESLTEDAVDHEHDWRWNLSDGETARKLLFVHGVRFAALLGMGGGSILGVCRTL